MQCYYHPAQPLLNFCTNPSCALPLCPKCINVHLSQSTLHHSLLPLNEVLASVGKQLQNSMQSLSHELDSLRDEYNPQTVARDYTKMLNEHRDQALSDINRHYDYLQKEVLSQITTLYNQHLYGSLLPLQNQLKDITTHTNNIKGSKSLQTLVFVVSEQTVPAIQQTLLIIKDKKALFKSQLPLLQDSQFGKLRIAARRLDLISKKQSLRSSRRTVALPDRVMELTGFDRINELQARLQSLRYSQAFK